MQLGVGEESTLRTQVTSNRYIWTKRSIWECINQTTIILGMAISIFKTGLIAMVTVQSWQIDGNCHLHLGGGTEEKLNGT